MELACEKSETVKNGVEKARQLKEQALEGVVSVVSSALTKENWVYKALGGEAAFKVGLSAGLLASVYGQAVLETLKENGSQVNAKFGITQEMTERAYQNGKRSMLFAFNIVNPGKKVPLNGKEMIKHFEKIGYEVVKGGKGSHTKLVKEGCSHGDYSS